MKYLVEGCLGSFGESEMVQDLEQLAIDSAAVQVRLA